MQNKNKFIKVFLMMGILFFSSEKKLQAVEANIEPNSIFIGTWYLINDEKKKEVELFVKIFITDNNKEFTDIAKNGDRNELFIRYEYADDMHRFANVYVTCEKLSCIVKDRGNKMIFKFILSDSETFLVADGVDVRLAIDQNNPKKIQPMVKMKVIGHKFMKVERKNLRDHVKDDYKPLIDLGY